MNMPSNAIDKNEIKLLLFVLFCILFIEIFARSIESRMSGNIKHMYDIPNIVAAMDNINSKKLVFLGNSLTNEAIDPVYFRNTLAKNGVENYHLVKVTPDATSLWDWYFIYKNQIFGKNIDLDAVITGFAWGQLADQNRVYPSRLAGYFCNLSDIVELIGLGMDNSSDILEFLVAKASQVYVNREVIRKRSLDTLIPAYREVTQYINNTARSKNLDTDIDNTERQFSYQNLERLLDKAKKKKLKLVFVAMPVIDPYPVDGNLMAILAKQKVMLVDFRNLSPITKEMFVDGIHLSNEGAKVFSTELADYLYSSKIMFAE